MERGPRVILERINIAGNTATLDKVIRRQFRAAEGDQFSADVLDKQLIAYELWVF